MNKIYNLLLVFVITSCGNQIELKNQIDQLQTQNDSLKSELKKYEDKYVFDKVYVKHFPQRNYIAKVGELFKGEFVFVPVMENTELKFNYQNKNEVYGDFPERETLIKPRKDNVVGFEFELMIETDTTFLYFEPQIKNKQSLKHKNAEYDKSGILDIIVAK